MSVRDTGLALLWLASGLSPALAQAPDGRFDHARHGRLFPSCASCHEGAETVGRPLWPDPVSCVSCHDGTIQRQVDWEPPEETHRSNLRFSHTSHPAITAPGSTACTACHTDTNAPAMVVRRTVVERCLGCHGTEGTHLAVAEAACTTCHLPLAQATRLTREDVARFPAPPSHRQRGFGADGHGQAARATLATCATCHARNYCASCHVNAPEQPMIRSLAADERSLAIRATASAPPSHRAPGFMGTHGAGARRTPLQCSTCHTRESCTSCHTTNPRVAAAMPPAGPGRASGARIARRPPDSHTPQFTDRHGAVAEATPASCAACHARTQCTECHRPSSASRANGYHPAGFLERHPSAAYARETSCTTCHNSQLFCTSCHVTSGLTATSAPLGAGYHDAKRFFLLGHGPAARLNLESCVSCHAERDCTSCHAAQGGRRFNPHGPGFNANRLRRKNPEPCTVCHGVNIPGAP